MCFNSEDSHRQDVGPRIASSLRHERQQRQSARKYSNDQDICANRSSRSAAGYDRQTLDKAKGDQ